MEKRYGERFYMKKETKQTKLWKGKFGEEYTKRIYQTLDDMEKLYIKTFDYTRTEINNDFLGKLDKSVKILEVGCNAGFQLLCLQKMVFLSLYGIEPQQFALDKAKENVKNAILTTSTAFNIPYPDNYFDVVFTSGVLIHISPNDIIKALKEIYRCSKRFIYGFEFFDKKYIEIKYHGEKNALWKTDFAQLYLKTFDNLKIVKEKRYTYLYNNDLIDTCFLLEKL